MYTILTVTVLPAHKKLACCIFPKKEWRVLPESSMFTTQFVTIVFKTILHLHTGTKKKTTFS